MQHRSEPSKTPEFSYNKLGFEALTEAWLYFCCCDKTHDPGPKQLRGGEVLIGVWSRFQSVPGGSQGRNSSSDSHRISEQREMNATMLPSCRSCFLHPPAFQSPAREMVLPTFRVGLPTFKTIPTDVPTAQPVLAQPLPQLRSPAQTTLEVTFKTNQHRVLKADTQEGVPPTPQLARLLILPR